MSKCKEKGVCGARAVRIFAARTGIDVIGNYIDRAFSAKSDHRPEFQRMIKDSYKHAFDCIIVWKLDRFSRNRYDSAHYKTLLRRNGVKVISAMGSISEGSEGILSISFRGKTSVSEPPSLS